MDKLLAGKKTFIVMGVVIILGAIESYNQHCGNPVNLCKALDIPPFVYSALGALGIWTRKVAKPNQ